MSLFTEEETAVILDMKTAARNLVINEIINPFNKFTVEMGYGKTDLASRMVVCGGFFATYLQDESPNDFDIFVLAADTSHISYVRDFLKNSKYFNHGSYKENKYDMNDRKIVKTMSASKTVTDEKVVYHDLPFQFIFSAYADRAKLLENFDFEHCKTSYSVRDDRLYISRDTFDAAKNKKLIYAVDEENVDIYRTKKFLERGYTW